MTDEAQLTRLATLSMDEVRPEFRAQVRVWCLRGWPAPFTLPWLTLRPIHPARPRTPVASHGLVARLTSCGTVL